MPFVLICALSGGAGSVMAQSSPQLVEPPRGVASDAYQSSAWMGGIRAEATYVAPSETDIPTDRAPRFTPPERARARDGNDGAIPSAPLALVAAAILAVIGFMVFKFGGAAQIGFSRRDDGVARPAEMVVPDALRGAGTEGPLEAFLARIRGMSDRREALILLVRRALRSAASCTRTGLVRSDTARSVLRKLPGNWQHGPTLKKIVVAQELVQFGGREIDADTFEALLTDTLPILRAQASA